MNNLHLMNFPLVSIIALSYRSVSTIVDTLESIAHQTYQRLELILCDDGSDDGTVEIAKKWLIENEVRFERVTISVQCKNIGIVRNYEAGLKQSHGGWIKPIACDDILCEDAISKFIEQTQSDGTELAFSQITRFRKKDGQLQALGNLLTNEQEIALINQSTALLQAIRRENFLPAPSAFYSRRLFEAAGGIDISFKHLDDWPLWLRMLPLIQRVSWIDKPLVLYRVSEHSVSQKQKTTPIGGLLHVDRQQLFHKMQRQQLSGIEFWHMHLQMLRQNLTFQNFGNSWLAYRLLMPMQLLSPLTWKGLISSVVRSLILVKENFLPLARGAYYFGPAGLRGRVRVFGSIHMAIPRSRISIGNRVVIYGGVALIGKKGSNDTISIGSFSTLEKNCYLNAHGGSIVLGDHVHVGVGCVMQGFGSLVVGDNTMFGPYAQVYTSNHRSSNPPVPRRLLGERRRPVTLGRNCWIAANCIVLPGTQIADESIIPASEVVRRKDENLSTDIAQLSGAPDDCNR
jgi:acetyltransferase-like isoleucine patch superfamily enzyme